MMQAQQAGDVITRLRDLASDLGTECSLVTIEQPELPTEASSDDLRIDEAEDGIEVIELDDDWREIDLEEVGVR